MRNAKERTIFDELANLIREKYENAYIIPEQYSVQPSKFPAVSIVFERQDSSNGRYSTFSKKRVAIQSSIQVDVYGVYEECVAIANIIDSALSETFRYTMTSDSPLLTGNSNVKRRTMRFYKDDFIIEEE